MWMILDRASHTRNESLLASLVQGWTYISVVERDRSRGYTAPSPPRAAGLIRARPLSHRPAIRANKPCEAIGQGASGSRGLAPSEPKREPQGQRFR